MHTIKIEQFIQRCREHGLKVTSPRILIYRKLLEHTGHPSAEDIFREVKTEHAHISLAMVYKTMEMLAAHNLIAKVTQLHYLARYDCNNDFHHHFVCIECKKIIDVVSEQLNNLPIPKQRQNNFRILNYRVQFDGLCDNCQTTDQNQ